MSLTQYYTATSLDGFIADREATLDWLHKQEQDPDGPLVYKDFYAAVGALAMGSTTYEWILGRNGDWPYDLPCWVFTHRELAVPPGAQVQLVRGNVRPVHEEMAAAAAGRNLWIVGGGDLAGQFADAGLLDEVIVWIAPVTLGGGAPLFPRRIDLRLEELVQNGAFACARYSVVR